MPPENPDRGGKRKNSGRPKLENKKQFQSVGIGGTPTEISRLKEKAKNAEKSTSRFVLESLECTDEQNPND